jgi:hypothetical protein
LRTAGKIEEAGLLESTGLPPVVKTLRDSTTVSDAQLEVLFAAEEERVSTARLLAEILLPMLTEAIAAASVNPSASASSAALRTPPVVTSSASVEKPVAAAASAGTTPGIADFIDEMLSQERAPRSSRRSA